MTRPGIEAGLMSRVFANGQREILVWTNERNSYLGKASEQSLKTSLKEIIVKIQ